MMIPRYISLRAVLLLSFLLLSSPANRSFAEEHDYREQLKPIAPRSPEEAMKAFQVADGFRIELAASEPNVVDPVAMAFDADGRLFVIEMRGYSEDDGDVLGRVRLLEDTNDDGTYEKSTIFAEDFSWPTAICCTRGGVLVGAAPDIIWLKDTDNDGQADERQVVFTGFGKSNVQGLMNTFKWGLDNRIHGVTSSSGANLQKVVDGNPVGKPVSLRGRDFAIDPLAMDLTPISGGGQHGMSMNSWGEKFTCSNSDHLQQVVLEDRYLARNPYLAAPPVRRSIATDGPQAEVYRTSPVEAWRVIRTRLRANKIVPGVVEGGGRPAGYFTGATGVTLFRGDGWPEAYQGMAIVGDVGSNLIHRKQLVDTGIVYQGVRVDESSEFVSSSDIWFRPVQYANAPDGSLYVADMYREVIEHPKSLPEMIKKHLDLTSGRDRGRIYRIVGDDFQRRPTTKLSRLSSTELVGLLNHPNSWQRETAARLIYERQDVTAAPALIDLLEKDVTAEAKLLALYALDGLNQLTPTQLLAAMDDKHPRVRQHAVRLSESHLTASKSLRDKLQKLATDTDPKVRFQVAFSAGYLPTQEKAAVLTQIAKSDADDRDFRAAIQSSLATGAGEFLAQYLQQPPESDALLNDVTRQIGKQQRQDDIAVLVALLPQLRTQQPKRFTSIVKQLNASPGSPLAQQLAKATSGGSQMVIAEMIRDAHQTSLNGKATTEDRIRAIEVLRFADFDADLFDELLQPTQPLSIQTAALQAMQRTNSPEVAKLLLDRWPSLGPGLRTQAAQVLTSRSAWAGQLIDAIAGKRIASSDVNLTQLASLKSILNDEQSGKLADILKGQTNSDRAKIVSDYRAALSLKGNVERGQAVFTKHCTACHQYQGQGHPIGPNLAAMKNRGAEAILVNVLQPNAEVNPQYMNYLCLTTDGRNISGIITNETSTAITLVQGDNKTETILRIDIDQLRSTGTSLMPEGLEKVIDHQAMADVLAFLTQSE